MSDKAKSTLKWLLLIGMFLGIYQCLATNPTGTSGPAPEPIEPSRFVTFALGVAVMAGAVIALRRFSVSTTRATRALAIAQQHLGARRFDEAEAVLEPTRRSRLRQNRRAAEVMRAEIALLRGDRDGARAHAEAAVAIRAPWLFKGIDGRNKAAGHATLAFVRASAGDEAGAHAAIQAVRAANDVDASSLARAALAEVMLAERRGDRAAMRDALDRSRGLLYQSCSRPERAIVRAYEAMLDAGSAPVYRQKAADDGGDRRDLAELVACYAPAAAPFVRALPAPSGKAGADREPSDEATRKVEAARPRKLASSQTRKTLLLWVALVGAFLAVWQLGEGSPPTLLALMAVLLGAIALWMAARIRRQREESGRIRTAVLAHGSGDFDRIDAALSFEPVAPMARLQAHHFRAEAALWKGDAARALAELDRAFAALAETQGGAIGRPAAPAEGRPDWDITRILVAQRSFALAMLGRFDEARAEIAWANGMPTELPRLRVRLAERLAAHDYEGAADLVETRDADLAPTAREETLFELVRFVARPLARSDGEAARLRAEIARTPHFAAWLAAIAPGLEGAFEQIASAGAAVDRSP